MKPYDFLPIPTIILNDNIMVFTNNYTAGDNQFHHGMLAPWPVLITAKILSCK